MSLASVRDDGLDVKVFPFAVVCLVEGDLELATNVIVLKALVFATANDGVGRLRLVRDYKAMFVLRPEIGHLT